MWKYNKYVKAQFQVHHLPEKTFALERKALTNEFSSSDIHEFNMIQHIQNDIRRRARKKCRRFYTSQTLYTKDLGIIYRRRKLWRLMAQKRLGLKVDVKAIRRLMRQVNELTAFQLS